MLRLKTHSFTSWSRRRTQLSLSANLVFVSYPASYLKYLFLEISDLIWLTRL